MTTSERLLRVRAAAWRLNVWIGEIKYGTPRDIGRGLFLYRELEELDKQANELEKLL